MSVVPNIGIPTISGIACYDALIWYPGWVSNPHALTGHGF